MCCKWEQGGSLVQVTCVRRSMRNEWKKETQKIPESQILKRPLERTKGLLERTTLEGTDRVNRRVARATTSLEWFARAGMEPLQRT